MVRKKEEREAFRIATFAPGDKKTKIVNIFTKATAIVMSVYLLLFESTSICDMLQFFSVDFSFLTGPSVIVVMPALYTTDLSHYS